MRWAELFYLEDYVKNIEYLTFGRYYSDDYSIPEYTIYNLTKEQLFIDKRQLWDKKWKNEEEYIFRGQLASKKQHKIAEKLLHKIPDDLLSHRLRRFGRNSHNKHQDNLIIEFYDGKQKTNVIINDHMIESKKINKSIIRFRSLAEDIIAKLEAEK